MVAETTPDGKFIRIIEYSDFERKQIESSFTKQVANWRFIKKKFAGWDGYIKFIDSYMRIPIGLWRKLETTCEKYKMSLEWKKLEGVYDHDFKDDDFKQWVVENFKNAKKKPRDYQIESALQIMKYMKSRSEIATSAGKTLIIYMIYQYLKDLGKLDNKKMLVVVPTTSLIIQTSDEFEDYAISIDAPIPKVQMMHGGKVKEKQDVDVVIGTFQTLNKLDLQFFDDINVTCIDECLHPNSIITMSDNSIKKIKDVNIGDLVKVYDENINTDVIKEVEYVYKNLSKNQQMYEMELVNGSIIKLTGNHKVLLTDNTYKRVDKLNGTEDVKSLNWI